MSQLPIERLVEAIVRAVLTELSRRGVSIAEPAAVGRGPERAPACTGKVVLDYADYKTPVLTEAHVRSVPPSTREIVVPSGTLCTIGAKDLMAQRKLVLSFAPPSS